MTEQPPVQMVTVQCQKKMEPWRVSHEQLNASASFITTHWLYVKPKGKRARPLCPKWEDSPPHLAPRIRHTGAPRHTCRHVCTDAGSKDCSECRNHFFHSVIQGCRAGCLMCNTSSPHYSDSCLKPNESCGFTLTGKTHSCLLVYPWFFEPQDSALQQCVICISDWPEALRA